MRQEELSFLSAGLRLAGTFATPGTGGPFPCVLLPGSGQVDRNEDHKKLSIGVLRQIADDLAGRGIASFRYDKRGVGQSEGDFWMAGLHDQVADAEAALTFLGGLTEVDSDRLFVLGHSEGAYISVRVAAESSAVTGVVLLAGGARTGEEELRWQARQVIDTLTGFNAFLIKLLRIDALKSQGKQVEKIKRSTADSYRVGLRRLNAKWMREFLAYDPAPDLARIMVPVLAITGAKDIQVDPDNLERMATLLKAPFESHVVPDVTHLLRSESGPGGLATYKEQARRPVDPRVMGLVGGWVAKHAAAGSGFRGTS